MSRPLLSALALGALIAGATASPLRAADSRLFLSWRAPYGEPRATDSVIDACRDSSRVDTLYLCFEIGALRPAVSAISGVVTFTPQPGDTLLPFWFFKRDWPNQGNMYIDFPPFKDRPFRSPWEASGYGHVNYDHRSGRGRLDIFYEVSARQAQSLVPGARYCFARVRILQRRLDLAGCGQPVCVSWEIARIGFATGRQEALTLGHRFATWNSPDGSVCGPKRGIPLTRPWQPKFLGAGE